MRLIHGGALLLSIMAVGCASGGGATGGSGDPADPTALSAGETFSQDVGLATITDLRRITESIMERYQYEIERFDEGAYTVVDSYWKDRQLLPDERDAGFVGAQTRLLIRTRLRARATTQTLAVHRVTFQAENMLRRTPGGEWEFGILTDDFKDLVENIARQFESEFRAGIRR